MWIIYKHTNLINNKIYIGQTCQKVEERWRKGKGYDSKTYFAKAINKYGWDNFSHQIIEENILTRQQANEREEYWIKFYHSNDPNYGYNMTEGGDGFNPKTGSYYSKKNWEDSSFRKKFEKPVICVNTGIIYKSLKEAANKNNIHKDSISKCCTHIYKSAGTDQNNNPLVWEFFEEGKIYKYKNPKQLYNNSSRVICTTTQEIFNSIQEAANKYNIKHSGISSCCTHKQQSAGKLEDGTKLCWEYYEEGKEYKKQYKIGNTNSKKVICINTGKIYNSLKEAGMDTNVKPSNISMCCNGKIQSAGKMSNGDKRKWRYYKEDDNE